MYVRHFTGIGQMIVAGKTLIALGFSAVALGLGTFQYHHFLQKGTVNKDQALVIGRMLLLGLILLGSGFWIIFA